MKMKLSNTLKIAFISSLLTLFLLFLISGYTFRVFFSYKELSSRSLDVLTHWNNLDRLTNDILLRSAPVYGDLRTTVEGMQEDWLQEIRFFDESLNEILSYPGLDSYIGMPGFYRERLFNLWNYTSRELDKSQEDLERIIESGLGERLVINSFLDTFYQFRMLRVLSGSEIVLVIDFVNHLSVLDTTGEEITKLLLVMNDEIQSSVNRRSRQAAAAALSISLFLIIILILFVLSIRRVEIIEAQKRQLDRNARLNSFKALLALSPDEFLGKYLDVSYRLVIFAPDKDEQPDRDDSLDYRMNASEDFIREWFRCRDVGGETVRMTDQRIYSIINPPDGGDWGAAGLSGMLEALLADMTMNFSLVFSAAVSREGLSSAGISEIHEDVLEKLNYRFILPHKSVIRDIPTRKPIEEFSYPRHLEKKLVESLHNCDSDRYTDALDSLIELICGYHYLYIRSYLLRVTSAISWAAANIHQHTPVLEHESVVNLSYRINACQSLSEAGQIMKKAGLDIIALLMEKKEHRKDSLLRDIELLIGNRYSDPNLSATYIADALGLSTTYLNRTYRACRNDSITNLINNCRLEKAAELLVTSKTRINLVAETVGFVNSGYFFTLFKKHYGMTPREYRTAGRNSGNILPVPVPVSE